MTLDEIITLFAIAILALMIVGASTISKVHDNRFSFWVALIGLPFILLFLLGERIGDLLLNKQKKSQKEAKEETPLPLPQTVLYALTQEQLLLLLSRYTEKPLVEQPAVKTKPADVVAKKQAATATENIPTKDDLPPE